MHAHTHTHTNKYNSKSERDQWIAWMPKAWVWCIATVLQTVSTGKIEWSVQGIFFTFFLKTSCEKLFQFKFQLQNWDKSWFLIEDKKELMPQIIN